MEQLNVKDIERKMWDCVREQTKKANSDALGIDWV